MKTPDEYIQEISRLLYKIVITDRNGNCLEYNEGIRKSTAFFLQCKSRVQTVFFCGNGGSAGIAQHMTADYMKNGGLRTYSLYGQPTLTCISNDLSYKDVFGKQIELAADNEDLLTAISSSGESMNVVQAIQAIRKKNGTVLTLTGFEETNKIRSMGDINIYVPAKHYGMVESVHNLILQQIVDRIVEQDGVAVQ